ncbi:MAG: cadherin-like domain-containing protein [Xanthomonadales bacterium]|nr:cadherin-like domain-containing protein [Xanthomonadales bacterium]
MLRRFLLVSLLFSVTAQAQAPRFDQLVAGNGVASRAFTGSDSGQGGTGLRLTSMGRLQAAEATVWRLRNASAQSRAVRLESVDSGFSLSLSLPAGTELTLRSPVNAGAATHRLYEGAALIDTKAAGSEVYTDATPTSPSAGTNRPPQFLSAPGLLADVDQTYRYAPIVYDPDNDLLSLSVSGAPSRYQYVAARNAFEYLPQRAEIGSYSAVIRANDGRGGNTPQSYTLRVVQDFCPIYPIAIPHSVVANAQVGANLTVARGQNAGNFSWLSWAGQNNAPTLAQSLMPPGDSYLYRNPNDSTDSVLSMGDWIQGAPGNMQANAVVTAINALMGRDIIVPSFDQTRGQGAGFDYRSVRFVTIRLSQYVGSGQGSLSFSYRGLANCYSDPEALAREPVALWSHANAQNFQWDGTENRIRGLVHGNQNITLNGSRNDFEGSVRYVTTQTGSGNENRYLRWPVQSSLQALPHTVDVASFAPGSPLANSLGTQYRDQSARCGQGKWDINQPATQLPTGVHYIPCDVDISANNWSGNVTIISTGRVTLGGGGYQLTPFHRAVSIATSSTHAQSIRFSGGTSRIDGLVYSRGGIELGTQGWTHGCAIIGDRIRLSGSQNKYFPTCELSSAPPPNRQPVAIDATVTVAEDGTVSITLQATDPDGDALSYSIVGQPGKGTLSGTGAARTYTPDANYHGTDSFTFKANDGTVDSNTATVSITVTPVNWRAISTATR